MNFRRNFIKFPFAVALAGSLALTALPSFAQSVTLLNVSIRPHPGVVCGVQPGLCQILERKRPLALVGKAVEAIKIIAIRSADQWLRAKRLCIQLLRIKRPSP
jgi:hypothetical protein